MKALNIILAALFTVSAAVQYNDPDPWLWMAMYLFVAVISGFAAFGRYDRWALRIGLAVCLIWMGTLLPDFINWIKMGAPTITGSMKAEEPHIELTREFLGLVVCGIVLLFHMISYRKLLRQA
jgi:hypothetical protein